MSVVLFASRVGQQKMRRKIAEPLLGLTWGKAWIDTAQQCHSRDFENKNLHAGRFYAVLFAGSTSRTHRGHLIGPTTDLHSLFSCRRGAKHGLTQFDIETAAVRLVWLMDQWLRLAFRRSSLSKLSLRLHPAGYRGDENARPR